jgi:hypothetical protein
LEHVEADGMDALDLTIHPPRPPRAMLPGLELLFIARTLDKLRALLPGGNPGDYKIAGFSASILKALGIEETQLRDAVGTASSEADVVDWIRKHSDPSRYASINERVASRCVRDRMGDEEWVGRYPTARTVSPDTPLVDFLVIDDEAAFGSRR